MREKWSLAQSYKGLTMLDKNVTQNTPLINQAVSGDIQGLVPMICLKAWTF